MKKRKALFLLMALLVVTMLPSTVEAKSKKKSVSISMTDGRTVTTGDTLNLNVETNTKSTLSYKVNLGKSYAYVKSGKLYTKKAAKIKLTVTAKPKSTRYYKTTKKTVTIKINPANVSDVKVSRKDTYANVTVNKAKGATGYQFQYSTDKNFKKNVKTKTQNKTTYQFKADKLTTYYVRVRSFAKLKGYSLYGSWKTATLKKLESKAKLSKTQVSLSLPYDWNTSKDNAYKTVISVSGHIGTPKWSVSRSEVLRISGSGNKISVYPKKAGNAALICNVDGKQLSVKFYIAQEAKPEEPTTEATTTEELKTTVPPVSTTEATEEVVTTEETAATEEETVTTEATPATEEEIIPTEATTIEEAPTTEEVTTEEPTTEIATTEEVPTTEEETTTTEAAATTEVEPATEATTEEATTEVEPATEATTEAPVIPALKSATVTERNITMTEKGQTKQLSVKASPSNAIIPSDGYWTSTNEAVATITKDGLVTAIANGEANMQFHYKRVKNGELTESITTAYVTVVYEEVIDYNAVVEKTFTLLGGKTMDVEFSTDDKAVTAEMVKNVEWSITGDKDCLYTWGDKIDGYVDVNKNYGYSSIHIRANKAGTTTFTASVDGKPYRIYHVVSSDWDEWINYENWRHKVEEEIWTPTMSNYDKVKAFERYIQDNFTYHNGTAKFTCYKIMTADCIGANTILGDVAKFDVGVQVAWNNSAVPNKLYNYVEGSFTDKEGNGHVSLSVNFGSGWVVFDAQPPIR